MPRDVCVAANGFTIYEQAILQVSTDVEELEKKSMYSSTKFAFSEHQHILHFAPQQPEPSSTVYDATLITTMNMNIAVPAHA